MWQHNTFGDASWTGCVHDDGRIKLFRFDGRADLRGAELDNLLEAVEWDTFLIAVFVGRVNLWGNMVGNTVQVIE